MLSVHTCPLATLGGKKTGGMNVYIKELTRALGQRQIGVDIFTHCEHKDHADTKPLDPKGQVIHIPSGPQKNLQPMDIYPHLQQFTKNVIRHEQHTKRNYSLIHSHYWLSGLVALKLKSHWHIPLIQTFHTLERVKNKYLSPTDPSSAALRSNAEQYLVNQVDHILVSTQDEKHHLVNLYQASPDKITIIPPGVDTQKFHPIPQAKARQHLSLPPNTHLLLFVGRIEPLKGLHTLLKALHLLQPTPNLSLAIIGGGDDPDNDLELNRIKQLAQNLHLNNLAIFLGSKNQDNLPYYYSAADMTIIPSSYESFSLVALESMACATPVIASDVGGLKTLVKHHQTGLLIPSNQPQPLAKAIHLLLSHPDFKASLGDTAHSQAQAYSWHKLTPKFIKLYQKILQ